MHQNNFHVQNHNLMKLWFSGTLLHYVCTVERCILEVLGGFRDDNVTKRVLLLKEFRLDPDDVANERTIFIFDTLFPHGHNTRVLDVPCSLYGILFTLLCERVYYFT